MALQTKRLRAIFQTRPTSPLRLSVRGPWQGYTPDIQPALVELVGFRDCEGLVPDGDLLHHAPGWERIDAANQPLDSGNPIIGLPQFKTQDGQLRRIAITTRNLIPLTSDGQWGTAVPFGTQGSPLTNSSGTDFMDWAYWPSDDLLIFTNGSDNVYKWDTTPQYEEWSATAFRALSVEVFADRLNFLNVWEGPSLTHYPFRLRYTTTGSGASLSGTGSGFIDLPDLESEGLRAETLGEALVLYFSRGVAMLERTFTLLMPYSVKIIAKSRGLLGPRSMTPIGAVTHFCVCTDGWFLLDQGGRWTEVGLIASKAGRPLRKWQDTFYERLDWNRRREVYCTYDETQQRVAIAWPDTAGAKQLWLYDVATDTVWPQGPHDVNVLGVWEEESRAAATWASLAGTTWGQMTTTWRDHASLVGHGRVVHGSSTGLVLRHDERLLGRDGPPTTWRLETHDLDWGAPGTRAIALRARIETRRMSGGTPSITLGLGLDGRTVSTAVAYPSGSVGSASAALRGVAERIRITASGQAPVGIQALEVLATPERSEER